MKLIHCADLHLDSPLEANLPPEKVRGRRAELLSSFAKLVRLADENGVSAILIAGDLFDSIDEQNLSTSVRTFFGAANDDAGFHRCIEEQVRAEADDTFHHIALN